MAMAETIRAKAEEFRTRVRTRIEEIRGGGSSSSGILGNPGILKGPLATEIREKGLIATARARIERVRGGGGILGSSSPEKVAVERDTGIKFQRGRVAVEA